MYDSCLISQHDSRLIQFPTPGCVLLTIFAELLVCKSVSSSYTPLSIMMTYYFMGLQNDITKKSSCLSRISSLIVVPEVLAMIALKYVHFIGTDKIILVQMMPFFGTYTSSINIESLIIYSNSNHFSLSTYINSFYSHHSNDHSLWFSVKVCNF